MEFKCLLKTLKEQLDRIEKNINSGCNGTNWYEITDARGGIKAMKILINNACECRKECQED